MFSEILKRETLLNALVYIALLVMDIFILLHILSCKIKSGIAGDTIEFDKKTKEQSVYFLNFGKTLKS